MQIEDIGRLFKGDPMFDFIFNLPRSQFMRIYDLRKKRIQAEYNISTPIQEQIEEY